MYSLYIVLPSCSIWLQRNWMNNCLRRFTTLLQQSILNRSRSRRLSKVYCLNHFFNLFDPDRNESWREYLIASKYDITSMTDVFKIFNEVNLQLQGYELNLIRIKTVIAALAGKLPLFKRNLRRGEYIQPLSHIINRLRNTRRFIYFRTSMYWLIEMQILRNHQIWKRNS